ncbi:hypothetical protein BDD12DRAFT_875176 [Trichophaea hybrida]|nr:hypothetical protein BDD12DRAFT_875176 [Trichophaea hybrida]
MKKVLDIAHHNQTYHSNPAKISGFSTNGSNYNGYNPTTPDKISGPGPDNRNWSELRYAKALVPYLQAEGLPIHFIIDQQPAPEAGARSEDFVETLVKNANPPLKPIWKH